jgi:hypothetical protein
MLMQVNNHSQQVGLKTIHLRAFLTFLTFQIDKRVSKKKESKNNLVNARRISVKKMEKQYSICSLL